MNPLLVVVAGAPGAGKTTMARRLADRLFLPLLSRDVVKEALSRLGPEADDLGVRSFVAFYDLVERSLALGVGLVAEAAYQRPDADEPLRRLATISTPVLVQCSVPAALAVDRYRARHEAGERHPSHTPPDVIAELARSGWDRFTLDGDWLGMPTITVDTTDGYRPTLDDVVTFVET